MKKAFAVFLPLFVACNPLGDGAAPKDVGGSAAALDEGSNGEHGGRPLRIAWLGNDPGNMYDNASLLGAQAVAGATRSTVVPFYGEWDPMLQLAQCEEVVASREYDAVLVIPTDGVSIAPCVEHARERNMPIVAIDLPLGPDFATVEPQLPGQTGAVLTPAGRWADSLASFVVETCGSLAPCKVAYVAGSVSVPFDQAALAALEAAGTTHSNLELVAVREAYYDEGLAYGVTQEILATTAVDVLIGAGDQMAKGAELALADASLLSSVKVIGAGAGAYGVDAVRAGRWHATFVTLPGDEGSLGTDIAIRAARHREVRDPGIDPVAKRGYPAFFTAGSEAEFPGFTAQWPG